MQTVGILSADSILNIPSYLAAEQTFNLITQCAGRAGRSRKQGEVILQTITLPTMSSNALRGRIMKAFTNRSFDIGNFWNIRLLRDL